MRGEDEHVLCMLHLSLDLVRRLTLQGWPEDAELSDILGYSNSGLASIGDNMRHTLNLCRRSLSSLATSLSDDVTLVQQIQLPSGSKARLSTALSVPQACKPTPIPACRRL